MKLHRLIACITAIGAFFLYDRFHGIVCFNMQMTDYLIRDALICITFRGRTLEVFVEISDFQLWRNEEKGLWVRPEVKKKPY